MSAAFMHVTTMASNSEIRYMPELAGPRMATGFSMYLFCKRAMDLFVAGTMLICLAPVLAAVALMIKFTDGGTILFRQMRVGRGGREFPFYKFRSMVVNAEQLKARLAAQNHHHDPRTFKMKHDPRVTWIGRIIRKTSIDELPQLWNVLIGDMTLVGPRPAVPSEVAKYNAHERYRLDVVPGLTCIWQVSGRADVDFSRQVEMDLEYICKRSLWFDFKLLCLTLPAVISGRGAY